MKTTLSLYEELKRRNVLRVTAAYVVVSWLVIQVVETVFPAFGFGDAAVRIVTIILVIGLIPTFILSWAFEITPEGLKKEKDVDRSQSITAHTGKKLDRVIMVVMALAIGYFAIDKFVLSESREASIAEEARQEGRSETLVESYGDRSIAVLPFVNMSDDASNEYFSDGISEELLNLLAKIPELRVTSRSSAFSFKGEKINIPEVAKKLNVAYILEGSVRKAGNQVRITVQLIEARSDVHLWSETYDRTLDNIFAIQDEIALEVVEQLKVTLLGAAPMVKETDPEAFALYLQARHLGRQGTAEAFEQSIALYQRALTIDPEYPAVWIGLAEIYSKQASNGQRPMDEGIRLAREAVYKALVIDAEYAPTHGQLGLIAMDYDNDLAAAARHYERALALDPTNPDILGGASMLARSLGRLDDGVALLEYALVRDPVNATHHFNLGLDFIFAGRFDAAILSLRTALSLSPGRIGVYARMGDALLLKGEPEAALAAMQQDSFEGWRIIGLPMVYHAMGQAAESDAALAESIERFGHGAAYNIAYVLAFCGKADLAFDWLDTAVQYSDPGLVDIPVENLFANIHDDPRWLPFLESIGKSPEQLAAIEFKVTLPE